MKRVESVISTCLLGVLFLIGAAIVTRQFEFKIPLKSSSIAPAGFQAMSEAEVYNSETLYEKINGKAPLYLESGFKELATRRLASINNPDLWTEVYVYDMGNIRNSFSVYSVQKRAESQKFTAMQFAYKTSNALYFVHGEYYIEIIGSSESEELFAATEETAQKIQANLAVSDTEIAELKMFPQENLIPDSFKLYAVSAFGFEGLTDTFTAKYKFGGESVTAFLSKRDNAKKAEQIAERYRDFLIENGAAVKETNNKTLKGKVMDLFGTTEIVFTVGPFSAGVHEAENQQTAEKLAEMLINRLNNE